MRLYPQGHLKIIIHSRQIDGYALPKDYQVNRSTETARLCGCTDDDDCICGWFCPCHQEEP